MPSFESPLDKPFKVFTAAGFGAEKPGVDNLVEHALDATYSAHKVTKIQLSQDGNQVNVTSGDANSQNFSYSIGTKSITPSEMGISYDVYTNGDKNSPSHVKLSQPTFFGGGKNDFNIHADGKVIDGKCTTKDDITTCKQTVTDEAGNLLVTGLSTSDIFKNPKQFHQTTDYKDAAGKPLGRTSSSFEYDAEKGTLIIDSITTK